MKFSSSIALFAVGALAVQPVYLEPSIVERQSASTLDSDIAAISSAAAALDSAINAISSSADTPKVVAASNAVVSAIKAATSVAAAIPALSQADAINLVNPIQDLGNIVTTAVNDLIKKTSLIASFGECGTVLSNVQAQQTAATSFQNTLIPKVPSDLQSTAQSLAAPIISELSDAANAFQSCPASTVSATSSAPSVTSSVAPSSIVTSSAPGVTSTCDESSTSSVVSTPGSTPVSTPVSTPWTTSTYCPTSTAVVSTPVAPAPSSWIPAPSSNGTSPSIPATPSVSVLPSSGAEKVVVGFGALVMAALVAFF